MTTSLIEIDESTFDDRFTLLENHLNAAAGWAYGDRPGCLFETFGEELEFVRKQDSRNIWTYIDSDEGPMVVSGLHWVNRIGYLISLEPVDEGQIIEVRLDSGEN